MKLDKYDVQEVLSAPEGWAPVIDALERLGVNTKSPAVQAVIHDAVTQFADERARKLAELGRADQ